MRASLSFRGRQSHSQLPRQGKLRHPRHGDPKGSGWRVIYGARNNNAEGIKFQTASGNIVLKMTFPAESGLGLAAKDFKPTAITVAPEWRYLLVKRLRHQTYLQIRQDRKVPQALWIQRQWVSRSSHRARHDLDTGTSATVGICDRNHEPKVACCITVLTDEYIDEVITGLANRHLRRCKATTCLCLTSMVAWSSLTRTIHHSGSGHNPDPKKGGSFNIPAIGMGRRHIQRHTWVVLGSRWQPVCSRLECFRTHHEARSRSTRIVIQGDRNPSPTSSLQLKVSD